MSDIFNEIDEELRGDQMRKLWDKYSGLLLAVAILIVVGVAGFRGWDYYQDQKARAAGDKYLAALDLSKKGDYAGAAEALKAVASESAGYAILARLRQAGELALAGKQPDALAAYDALARDGSLPAIYKRLAAIRAAELAIDSEDRPAFDQRLAPLLAPGEPWRHPARLPPATTRR